MPLTELEDENHKLKETDARLRKELELLKTHPVFLAAIRGETLVCDLVGGQPTPYAATYDVTAGKCGIEVKYSNLRTPVPGS
jgi:hypothetical protein